MFDALVDATDAELGSKLWNSIKLRAADFEPNQEARAKILGKCKNAKSII